MKNSYIGVRKSKQLEASIKTPFSLLPHYQTTDMFELFLRYLLEIVRT